MRLECCSGKFHIRRNGALWIQTWGAQAALISAWQRTGVEWAGVAFAQLSACFNHLHNCSNCRGQQCKALDECGLYLNREEMPECHCRASVLLLGMYQCDTWERNGFKVVLVSQVCADWDFQPSHWFGCAAVHLTVLSSTTDMLRFACGIDIISTLIHLGRFISLWDEKNCRGLKLTSGLKKSQWPFFGLCLHFHSVILWFYRHYALIAFVFKCPDVYEYM